MIDSPTHAFREAEARYHEASGVRLQERTFEVPKLGILARFLEMGTGPAILAVHGGGGLASSWVPLLRHLPGYRLIVPDRPGCGLSDGFDYRNVDLREHAIDFLSAVLDAAEVESASVVANSMGGLWSLWLAQRYPERVQRLALLGTPARILETSAPFGMRLLGVPGLNRLMMALEPPSEKNVRLLWKRMGHDPDRVCSPEMVQLVISAQRLPQFQQGWLTLLENVLPFARINPAVGFGEEDLRGLSQDVFYIWGQADPFGSLDVARRVQDLTPASKLETIGVGHLPWLDEPEACGRAVDQFFESAS